MSLAFSCNAAFFSPKSDRASANSSSVCRKFSLRASEASSESSRRSLKDLAS
eukprot:CAMPEP_0183468408 /NCGR_PEP_ID=MMETSP0370-20130417/152687_1 /TAXON_ID=268820 /ORGANISM="Peridinium aciculiferum, Strain PAER-2" /LENGTH=51 /DNA_ID=CAMNT_0025660799 /DNA_START=59 /DNA_END=214 /DNA_ORIENTATION=-